VAVERIRRGHAACATSGAEGIPKADQPLAEALLRGVLGNADALRQLLTPYLDREIRGCRRSSMRCCCCPPSSCAITRRPRTGSSSTRRSNLREFRRHRRHKYVNGVLDKLAAELRPDEVNARNADRVR